MADRAKQLSKRGRLNVRRDTVDFRDLMYIPTLVDVPAERPLAEYRKAHTPILDQGTEGACTGFGLATVVNYLMRTRKVRPSETPVSPQMLYHLARRYDEWPGEDYEGSSARGAMKGWQKHGVCAEKLWKGNRGRLSHAVLDEAVQRPLGAYFRVNHRDLVAMHCAITETGILYATSSVHAGWDEVGKDGRIVRSDEMLGGHAFAIVGYDAYGFWIQNSWGDDWGLHGFACISYDDWLANGDDVWVARLGVPVSFAAPASIAQQHSGVVARSSALVNNELRRYVVNIGNNGALHTSGTFGTDVKQVQENIEGCGDSEHVVLYAHGGLVDEACGIQTLADLLPVLAEAKIHPIAFIWRTGFLDTLHNILREALGKRRPEGVIDGAKDFLLDRLDDTLEPIARYLGGRAQWDEMKENALAATTVRQGGARLAAKYLHGIAEQRKIHLVAHSAGSIFFAPLVQLLATKGTIASGLLKGQQGLGLPIASCTLWAPAITVDLFKQTYLPLIKSGAIGKFTLFTLDDKTEQDDDCHGIYHKSLLYLVSRAFEQEAFGAGVPLLGMEKFVRADKEVLAIFNGKKAEWILAPNQAEDPASRSQARHHQDFHSDAATVAATVQRMIGAAGAGKNFRARTSASNLRARRKAIEAG